MWDAKNITKTKKYAFCSSTLFNSLYLYSPCIWTVESIWETKGCNKICLISLKKEKKKLFLEFELESWVGGWRRFRESKNYRAYLFYTSQRWKFFSSDQFNFRLKSETLRCYLYAGEAFCYPTTRLLPWLFTYRKKKYQPTLFRGVFF